MINRTYIAQFNTLGQGAPAILDICVQATMGTRLLPVADPVTYGAANVTAPPAGWVAANGNGAYYEVRGRTLSLEHLFGAGAAAGFVQRTNLGFHLTVTPYGSWLAQVGNTVRLGGVQLSQSLLAAVGGDVGAAIAATNLADPVYGVAQPVIRIHAPNDGESQLASGLLVVSLLIAERKDDDYANIGSP